MKKITINVYERIGGELAISSEGGEIVFNLLTKAFEQKAEVTLDFINIQIITPTFLNATMGQLYSKYTSQFLNSHLKVVNLDNYDMELLKKVIENAKVYFKKQEAV